MCLRGPSGPLIYNNYNSNNITFHGINILSTIVRVEFRETYKDYIWEFEECPAHMKGYWHLWYRPESSIAPPNEKFNKTTCFIYTPNAALGLSHDWTEIPIPAEILAYLLLQI